MEVVMQFQPETERISWVKLKFNSMMNLGMAASFRITREVKGTVGLAWNNALNFSSPKNMSFKISYNND